MLGLEVTVMLTDNDLAAIKDTDNFIPGCSVSLDLQEFLRTVR